MAYVADNRTATIALSDRFSTLFASFTEARARRKVFTQTFAELNNLSNAELADIGMNRSMIKSVALEAAAKV